MDTHKTIDRLSARIQKMDALQQVGVGWSTKSPMFAARDEARSPFPRFGGAASVVNDQSLSLDELLGLSDVDFVNAAYRAALGRAPDAEGANFYLNGLRSGQIGKKQVVAALRFSREGRQKGLRLPGLWWPRLTLAIGRVPIFGYGLRLFANVARLPRLAASLQSLDALLAIRFNELTRTGNAVIEAIDHRVASLDKDLSRVSQLASTQSREVETRLQDDLAKLGTQLEAKRIALAGEFKALRFSLQETAQRLERSVGVRIGSQLSVAGIDELYASFEESFRGSPDLIRTRQQAYLEHIAAVANPAVALDIGPGRGEWLELLRDNGWVGVGLEINPIFVAQNQQRGLDVRLEEAVEGLRKFSDGTFSLVTAFHVIEHIDFHQLLTLIDEIHRVLRTGGMLIFETPNPENLITASCNFYLDPTHRNPIPPALAAFLVVARGFDTPQVLRLHSDADPQWEKIGDPSIRQLLSGPQDYAVIARRP